MHVEMVQLFQLFLGDGHHLRVGRRCFLIIASAFETAAQVEQRVLRQSFDLVHGQYKLQGGSGGTRIVKRRKRFRGCIIFLSWIEVARRRRERWEDKLTCSRVKYAFLLVDWINLSSFSSSSSSSLDDDDDEESFDSPSPSSFLSLSSSPSSIPALSFFSRSFFSFFSFFSLALLAFFVSVFASPTSRKSLRAVRYWSIAFRSFPSSSWHTPD